jgi:hypothetical protein
MFVTVTESLPYLIVASEPDAICHVCPCVVRPSVCRCTS